MTNNRHPGGWRFCYVGVIINCCGKALSKIIFKVIFENSGAVQADFIIFAVGQINEIATVDSFFHLYDVLRVDPDSVAIRKLDDNAVIHNNTSFVILLVYTNYSLRIPICQ